MRLAAISWHVDTRREVLGLPWFPHGVLIAVGFLAGLEKDEPQERLVREVAALGGDISAFVHEGVKAALYKRMR